MHTRLKHFLRALSLACVLLTASHSIAAPDAQTSKQANFSFSKPAKVSIQQTGTTATLRFSEKLRETPASLQKQLGSAVRKVTITPDGKTVTLSLTKPYQLRQSASKNGIAVRFTPTAMTTTTTTPAKPPGNMLSTKKAVATAPANMLSTQKAAPAASTQVASTEMLTTKTAPTKAPAPAPTAEVAPATASPVAAAPLPNPEGFVVSARKTESGLTLNFPWEQRTAAAVFERGRNIWIIFSRQGDAKLPLLRTVLPPSVVDVQQYAYPENTVIRLTTDGSLHAGISQATNGFGWNVALGPQAAPAMQDVSLKANNLTHEQELILGAYDVSSPVRFYDPHVGDWLIIIPSYEQGRGILYDRTFPEFALLKSAQGIPLVAANTSLATDVSRAGISLRQSGGLAISSIIQPISNQLQPITTGANAAVFFPYQDWFVAPAEFHNALSQRLLAIASAGKDKKPEGLLGMMALYLGQGRAAEAKGYLDMLRASYPEFYKANKLALYDAATSTLLGRMTEAAQYLTATELASVDEARLWQEVVGLYVAPKTAVEEIQQQAAQPAAAAAPAVMPSTAPAEFHYLKWNNLYIRFYPPGLRQYLAKTAADNYLATGEEEKALAAYDSLIKDSILEPLGLDAEYTLAMVALKKKQYAQANEVLERLSKQHHNRAIQARARFALAMMRYQKGEANADATAEALQLIRTGWRGDALERKILDTLVNIYKDEKRYDDTLRSLKAITENFPSDPEILNISGQMTELFQQLYLDGMADEMPPLKSLSLFYEFRDLTPVGPKGDLIIQHLADRLAAFDLLDRATQLLEHQIKYRLSAADRSRVGARLALLHLLNTHPQEALDVLQSTNFGGNTPELQRQRQQLMAEALSRLGKNTEALGMLGNDTTPGSNLLRLNIVWAMKDWPNVVNAAEDMLAQRPNLTDPLTASETEILLKLALAYSFEGNNNQLRYLRDYYANLIPDSAYKKIFDFITNDTNPVDPEDVAMITKQISNTEGFLDTFKAQIKAGKLSEAVK